MVKIAKELKELSLRDITPPSLTPDPTIQGIIHALDPEFQAITQGITEAQVIPCIDTLTEQALDLLAWQFHADFYDLAGTLRMKREAVKNSLLLHAKKGTVWAVKEALRQLDVEAEYVAWWESGGEPYTFGLRAIVGGEFYRTSGRNVLIRSILRAVDEAKSARSVMEYLKVEIPDEDGMTLYAGAVMSVSEDYEIGVDWYRMHELLLRFEDRINARMDRRERDISGKAEAMMTEVLLTLGRIENALCWSDDDE